MKKDVFVWYSQNDFPGTVVSKAEEIVSLVEMYYEMEFYDVFISNTRQDGQDEYPSLWLFSEHDAVECKDFLTRFDIDIVRCRGNVKYVNIISNNCDVLINPAQASKMHLAVKLGDELRCNFYASGPNCQRLSDIAKRFLKEYKSGWK